MNFFGIILASNFDKVEFSLYTVYFEQEMFGYQTLMS